MTVQPGDLEAEVVQIDSLVPFPGNARQGDVGAICQSLQAHGQFRPLVVQRSTGHVLAGNHTLFAARDLGWTEIAVTRLDVDDEQAKRIVAVDNRSQDLASYDDAALAEMLTELAGSPVGLEGTGFDGDDLDDLLAALQAPDLDDLAEEHGEPTERDGWHRVSLQVPPRLLSAWQEHVQTHLGDEVRAFAALLDVDVTEDLAGDH